MHRVKWITNLMLSVHQNERSVKEMVHVPEHGRFRAHKKVREYTPDFLKMSLAQHSPAPFSFLQETTLS